MDNPNRESGSDASKGQDKPRGARSSAPGVLATMALGSLPRVGAGAGNEALTPAAPEVMPPLADPGALFEPTVIADEYRVLQKLGAGGMGVVYLAERMRDGQRVALKLLLPQYVHDQMLCARLRREAQAVSLVQHPNVVQTLDAGEDPTFGPYVVFEHLNGQSLSHRLDALGRVPVETALLVMDGILAALDAAHQAGVVHRDLKPDNVFLVPGVTEAGDPCEHVKVLDFGISRILCDGSTQEQNQKLTRTGVVMGTPVYMSPEQALGKPTQDHRVDVYAAGVLLYEMLSGALPHEGENYNQVLAHALSSEPIPLVRRGAHVDPLLAEIVHKAIARDAIDRYPSAGAFRDAIASWARGSMVPIPRTSMVHPPAVVDPGARPEAVTMDAPRTETSVFAVAPAPYAMPVTMASAPVAVQQLDPEDAVRNTLPASPQRRRWVAPVAAALSVLAVVSAAVLLKTAPAESANQDAASSAVLLHSLGPTVLDAASRAAANASSKHAVGRDGDADVAPFRQSVRYVPAGESAVATGSAGDLDIVADNPYTSTRR